MNEFEFEKNIEESVVTYLTDNGISARRSRNFSDITTDDIEVYFEYGGSLDETRSTKQNHFEYDSHEGNLSMIVSTNRDSSDMHLQRIGDIRKLFLNYLHPLDGSTYLIHDIKPLSCSTSEDEQMNFDSTLMNFNIKFQIDIVLN
jgi:hypothetical protein